MRLFGVMIPPGRERERVVCEEIGDKHFCRHFIVSCDGFALFFLLRLADSFWRSHLDLLYDLRSLYNYGSLINRAEWSFNRTH